MHSPRNRSPRTEVHKFAKTAPYLSMEHADSDFQLADELGIRNFGESDNARG
jgi:hypothetical protein